MKKKDFVFGFVLLVLLIGVVVVSALFYFNIITKDFSLTSHVIYSDEESVASEDSLVYEKVGEIEHDCSTCTHKCDGSCRE